MQTRMRMVNRAVHGASIVIGNRHTNFTYRLMTGRYQGRPLGDAYVVSKTYVYRIPVAVIISDVMATSLHLVCN